MARRPVKATKEINVTPPCEGKLDFDDDNLIAIAEVYLREGIKEFRQKEFSNAIYFFTEGIKVNCKVNVKNAKLYSNRATAHFKLGNYQETLNDATAAIKLEPTFVKAIERGASACVELHLYEEAITFCGMGLTIDKNNKTLLDIKSRSVDELRKLQLKDQEKEKSISESKTVVDQKNENVYACEVLGNVCLDRKDYKAAIHYCERHLHIATESGDKTGQGRAHSHLGRAYFDLGDFKAAIHHHERDLEIAKELRNKNAEGRAYGNLGITYHRFADLKKAVDYYECSLKIDEEIENRTRKVQTYAYLARAFQDLGDLEKAINFHTLHLKCTKELGDRAEEGTAYLNFGNAYLKLGNLKKALEYHELALEIAKELEDRFTEETAYANLGNDYVNLGNFRKAIHCHQLQIEIAEELGNKAGIGTAYRNLGISYENLGEIKTAIGYHDLHLKIAQEVGDKEGEGHAYGNLGNVYLRVGNFDKAIDYYERELKNFQDIGHRAGEGEAYQDLGIAYLKLEYTKKGQDYLERSLEIAKEVGDVVVEGHVRGNLGSAYLNAGDFKNAIEQLDQHLRIAKEVGDLAGEGQAYTMLGNAYLHIGDFIKAKEQYLRSAEIAKQVGDKDGEATAYSNLGCSLENLGFVSEALNCFQSSVKIFNDLRQRLQSKDEWKVSLRHMYQASYSNLLSLLVKQGMVVEALSAADKGRAQALIDLLELKYGIERPCDEFNPAETEEETMNNTLSCLPSNTVFTAIEQGVIVLWVVQKEKEISLRVKATKDEPKKDATTFLQSLIENAREKIGVGSGTTCEDRSLNKLRDDMEPHQRSGLTGSHSLDLQTSALQTLYDLAIGPIEDLVHGEELVIVPDGPLCLAPYVAFMDQNSKYLGESFRIRVIPSLNSLKLIADCPANHHCKTGALLVGDPWVEEIIDMEGKKLLEQLPCARTEVQMIGEILKTAPLTGKEATKDEVLKRLSSVALVHIAAHGAIETGEIALAPNPTRASPRPKETDFLLTMADVLDVKLRARLVVLSCCHSGRGEIKAEGVVGIARAFLGAGARSVLVSLWAIDDEATLKFMDYFYQHLVKGKSASVALNQAMKCMRESDKFSEVKYWAPFVLIGDDVTLELSGSY